MFQPKHGLAALIALAGLAACSTQYEKGSYGYDAAYLKKNTPRVIELKSADGASKLLICPDFQARVMTSTANGDTGMSFGWLNYELLATGEKKKQFNPVGGEERFWLGPEGGQYSIFFPPGDSFNIAHWQVPPFIDIERYQGTQYNAGLAIFEQRGDLQNYSGTHFSVGVERKIQLLDKKATEQKLHTALPDSIRFVAYETTNTLFNTGDSDWVAEKGLLSVWLLGMFTPSPQTKVIIPFHPLPNAASHITKDYFGPVPMDRLQVSDSMLYFTCDGRYRSKIGLAPAIAKPIAAAFDAAHNVLTVVLPQIDTAAPYVNSKWEIQREPYKGDVINSYNDGPLANGSQLGPFFEIESSSPALSLRKGTSAAYMQTTCHFTGPLPQLLALAKALGIGEL